MIKLSTKAQSAVINNPLFKKLIGHLLTDGLLTYSQRNFENSIEYVKARSASIGVTGFDLEIPFRQHQFLWAVASTMSVKGDLVELGTGRGYLAYGALNVFDVELDNRGKKMFLVDSFEKPIGLLRTYKKSMIYADDVQEVRRSFESFAAAKLLVGWVPEILPTLIGSLSNGISFLHVDLNHSEPEIKALECLYPLINPGGIILLDDYANAGRELQGRAFDTLASYLKVNILTTASGQGIIVVNDRR